MSGPSRLPGATDPGLVAARARVAALFRTFDRLTPDELARIGFAPAPDEGREPLLAALDEAAALTGRVALVDEARTGAREAVMLRYAAGALHPTFIGLNWGLSQGTVESRVGIAEALADAAAAAAVEDALEPEIAAVLALDAAAITGMAAGEASEGSLAQALRDPADPELRAGPRTRAARKAALIGAIALAAFVGGAATIGAGAGAFVAAVRAATRRGRGAGRRG